MSDTATLTPVGSNLPIVVFPDHLRAMPNDLRFLQAWRLSDLSKRAANGTVPLSVRIIGTDGQSATLPLLDAEVSRDGSEIVFIAKAGERAMDI